MVQFATFHLHDVARGWYETMLLTRPAWSPFLAWDEIFELVLAHFFPQSVRDNREREFETLVQIDQMSVMEYNVQFMWLSRYSPHLVATEKLWVQRFLEGLKIYLFRVIAGHGDMTYDEALNRALTIEWGNNEKGGNSCDSRKRFHLETSHGGHQGNGGGDFRDNTNQHRWGQHGGWLS